MYRNEAERLKTLLSRAQAAQKRRKPGDALEPVLAGFAVNWDPQSLQSLQAHADQLTHAMPEWIRLAKDGSFLVEEDALQWLGGAGVAGKKGGTSRIR